MWARKKIAEMELELLGTSPRLGAVLKARIVETSLRYGVLCRHTDFIALHQRAEKQARLPQVAVIPVDKPRGAASGGRSMGDILSQCEMDDGQGVYTQAELDSLLCCRSGGDAPYPEEVFQAFMLLETLYEKFQEAGPEAHTEEEFNGAWREPLLTLAAHRDRIDLDDTLALLDGVLALAAPFTRQGDTALDGAYDVLAGLVLAYRLAQVEQAPLSEIASLQNFDGSFGHCPAVRGPCSQAALGRFLTEGDAHLYQRQVGKLREFLNRAGGL
jgi:hypothetical protein